MLFIKVMEMQRHNALCVLRPYGETEIVKEGCVNHVGKRLGMALLDLVNQEKAHKVTIGGRKHGSLPQVRTL